MSVFEAQGTRIIQTPIQTPQANGIAERFVRTVRSECLDWLLVSSVAHLARVLTTFIEHDNDHRAHRSLELAPPMAASGRRLVWRARAGGKTARPSRRAHSRIQRAV
jgi:transposase InsO family protein